MTGNRFVIALLLLCFYSCMAPLTKTEAPQLIGSWKLIADQQIDSDGKVTGQDTAVSGLLIYTTEGKMSVQSIWIKTRSAIMSDTIMNGDGVSYGAGLGLNSWSSTQTHTIIDTYDAYFGDYSVDGKNKIVTHTIIGNLRPEKNGVIYKRKFAVSNDTLLLRSTDPSMKWQMAWVRVVKK